MLQTGQVLFRRLSVDFALVLPFKDSKQGPKARFGLANLCSGRERTETGMDYMLYLKDL
jgi:hypothetical protein